MRRPPDSQSRNIMRFKQTVWLLCLTLAACQPAAQSPSGEATSPQPPASSTSQPTQNPAQATKTAEIEKVEYKQQSKNGLCKIEVSYPQVKGLASQEVQSKVNNYLKQQFLESEQDFLKPFDVEKCAEKIQKEFAGQNSSYTESGDYLVGVNKDNILSIRYDKRLGILKTAAHPTKIAKAVTINLQDGKAYSYEDLFKPAPASAEKVNKLIAEKVAAKEPAAAKSFKPKSKYIFFVDKEGLEILEIFDIFALQSLTVTIKPSEIADIINPQGPLQALVK
ncbi:MAG: DUF4163 domain-containing protein [Oscillatoria princeps RMCB-10]|nr:DUF4163 domain-containing protein [Oscillatoria princeps RMCB-10]